MKCPKRPIIISIIFSCGESVCYILYAMLKITTKKKLTQKHKCILNLSTMKKLFIIALLMFSSISPLYAQKQEPLADQMKEKLKSEEFSVGILLQSIGSFSFSDDDFNGNQFDLGATRLSFKGTVDNHFLYKLQMDFRSSPSIKDAQVGYAFSDNFQLIAGSFKPYLSIDLDPNPGATDFINRARHVGAMLNTREIGLTALGEAGNLDYRFGMYNGTGLSRSNDGKFLYTARLGYSIPIENGSLKVGFNGAVNQTEMEPVGKSGLVSAGDRTLYGFFTQFDSNSIFGTFEFLQTAFDTPDAGEETITGLFGTLGIHLSEKTDLLGRWDHLEYDLRAHESELLTFGINHQATELISFQFNLLALLEDSEDAKFGASANFQFQF